MTRYKRHSTPKSLSRWRGHIRRCHRHLSCCTKIKQRKDYKRLGNKQVRTPPKYRTQEAE